jgi:hypothetical protein
VGESKTIQKLRDDCDNYDRTVQALKGLARELLWDDKQKCRVEDGRWFMGRRMHINAPPAPEGGKSKKKQVVTPDLVVQPDANFGYVVEAKASLPRDDDHRRRNLIQIFKYGEALQGWETIDERIKTHDVVLLVDHFHGKSACKAIEELRSNGLRSKAKLAVVRFGILERRENTLSLELECGELTSVDKVNKLLGPLAVPLGAIVCDPNFISVQLYDGEPPEPTLMKFIHESFMNHLSREELEFLRSQGEVELDVDVVKLRQLLSETIGPGHNGKRVPEIPKLVWVKRAMKRFVELGWAKGEDSEDKVFKYRVRKRRKEYEQFLKICARGIDRKSNSGLEDDQLDLEMETT